MSTLPSITIDLSDTQVDVTRPGYELDIETGMPTVDISVPGLRGQTGHQIVFGTKGPVGVKEGTIGYYPRVNGRITRVTASVSAQASGMTVPDVNISGTSIFTDDAHKPTLDQVGRHFDDADVIDVGVFTDTDYLTADVDVAGIGTMDLLVAVDYVEE